MVFSTTMSVKARLGFGFTAAMPLLAPYQLLIEPAWDVIPSLAWLFAVIVSLGAFAVTVLLLLVAILGINRKVVFDDSTRTIYVTESHLVQKERRFKYSFAEVVQLGVVSHDWSDGPSTYELRLTPTTGKAISFGDFSSRVDAESTLSSLRTMIGKIQ